MFKKVLFILFLIALWGYSRQIGYAVSCSCTGQQVGFSDCESAGMQPVCVGNTCTCTNSPLLPINTPVPTLAPNSCQCGGAFVIRDNCVNSTPYCIVQTNSCQCLNNPLLPTSPPYPSPFPYPINVVTDPFCTNSGGGANSDSPQINTALGCIPVKMEQFVPWILQYLFGIAGGISFLLMIYGFILVTTSSGDEKALQGARETITSAVTGLLISIFSLFILRLIAVNILNIPGIM